TASAPIPVSFTGVAPDAFVPAGPIWKFLDTGVALSAANGMQRGFPDTTWRSGPAQLGYGDGDEATLVSFGLDPPTRIPTTAHCPVFPAPANLTLSAGVFDADGSVATVEFFVNGIKLGEGTVAPFSLGWNGVTIGNYSLTALATDNLGGTGVSSVVSISVIP